jgi:acyl-CoA reductase-like NAD-dependent aldehyde dehydrogenase
MTRCEIRAQNLLISLHRCFVCEINKIQATQEVVTRVPESTQEEMKAAVTAASNAFKTWRETPIPARVRIMFNLQQLISKNIVR